MVVKPKDTKGVNGQQRTATVKSSDGIIVDSYAVRRNEIVRSTRSIDRHPSRTHTFDNPKEPRPQAEKKQTQNTKKVTKTLKGSAFRIRQFLRHAPKALSKLPRKTAVLILCVVVLTVGGGVVAAMHISTKKSPTKQVAKKSELVENLEYQTVVPSGKSIAQLGGWKRVSPAKSDPVYAYTDSISGVPISVSQQPLPKAFIGSADDKVSQLAKAYNATSIIDANGTKVYIGISSKGPQSTIFTRNNLLILIKSQKKIEDKDWVQYINLLS